MQRIGMDFHAFLAVLIRPNPLHPWFGLSLFLQLNTQVVLGQGVANVSSMSVKSETIEPVLACK